MLKQRRSTARVPDMFGIVYSRAKAVSPNIVVSVTSYETAVDSRSTQLRPHHSHLRRQQ